MAPIPTNVMSFLCGIIAIFTITPLDGCPIPDPPKSTTEGVNEFDLVPITLPVPSIPAGTPLQFNGSYPGQGDLTEQLGWWPEPVAPATSNPPIDFVSFIQYDAKEGIAFWIQRSAFQMYLKPVSSETYAVMLGYVEDQTKPQNILSGSFSLTEIERKAPQETRKRYAFGWKGDIDNWFVCGGKVGAGSYYGLYYGKSVDGCSEKFQLEARYYLKAEKGKK